MEEPWLIRLGQRLKSLRTQRGMTQEGLAEAAGFHPTYIQKVEAARISPSLDALVRLAGALRVPVATLVVAVDEPGADGQTPNELANLVRGLPEEWQRFVRALVEFLLAHPEAGPLQPDAAVPNRCRQSEAQ